MSFNKSLRYIGATVNQLLRGVTAHIGREKRQSHEGENLKTYFLKAIVFLDQRRNEKGYPHNRANRRNVIQHDVYMGIVHKTNSFFQAPYYSGKFLDRRDKSFWLWRARTIGVGFRRCEQSVCHS